MSEHQDNTNIPVDEIYQEKILAAGYDLLSELHDLTFHQGDGQGLRFDIEHYGVSYVVEDLRGTAERARRIAVTAIEALHQAETIRNWLRSGRPAMCANCGDSIDVAEEWRICRELPEHSWCHRPNATEQEDHDRANVIMDAEHEAYCEDRDRAGGPRHDDIVTLTFPDGRTVDGDWYVPGPAPLGAPIVLDADGTEVSPVGAQINVSGLREDWIEYGPPSLQDLALGAAFAAAVAGIAPGQDEPATEHEEEGDR
jgi:hypothetical protein